MNSKNPQAKAYFYQVIIESALGKKQEAIADYDRAIIINPNHARAYYGRARTKNIFEDREQIISDLSKAAELFYQQGQLDFMNRQ
jgi:tetratricopeptide (TPR) repeat protein